MSIRQEVEMEGRPLLQVNPDQNTIDAKQNPQLLLDAAVAHRPSFAHVEVKLDGGKQVLANWGSMIWMDGGVKMETWCYGGFCNACCWRPCARMQPCFNQYSGAGTVSFSFDLPGDILPFAATYENGWVMSDDGFVCGTPNTVVSGKFPGCCMAIFGGEGFFMTTVRAAQGSGTALFYAGGYGQLQRHQIPAGSQFFVHTGLFFAASDKTQFAIGCPGGCKSWLFSGEGFVIKIAGPAVIYTQNRNPEIMRNILNPCKMPPILEILLGGGKDDKGGLVGAAAGAM
jgi:uncharacterized protein (AIM24 family)